MSEKEAIYSGAKIAWVGIIDLSLFYKKLQEWLKIKKYGSISESRYVERVKPNGKQIEIVWKCQKKEKDNDYFNFIIDVKFLLIGVADAEIEKDGRKLKLSKIDATVEIESQLEKDAGDKWKDMGIWKKIYETYIIKQQIEEAKIDCYKDTSDLIEEIKKQFEMYSLK